VRRYRDEGWRLLGMSWEPEIAAGTRTAEGVAAVFTRMNELLGFPLEVEYCPHAAGPSRCWCRKPLPGLGLLLARAHGVDLGASAHLGLGAADRGFAARLGMRFIAPE